MLRHDAAMAIARINMISKMVASGSSLECIQDIEDTLENDFDYKEIADSIIEYVKIDTDPILYRQMLSFADTSGISKFKDTLVDEDLKSEMTSLTEAVERLRKFATELDKQSRKNPYLVDYLADKETESLLKRAVDAGLLDKEYQPVRSTKIYQLKLIAMAIISIRGIKTRKKWCHFEDQWDIKDKRLSKCEVPVTSGKAIYKVFVLYPEVDLMKAIDTRACQEKTFKTPINKKAAKNMYELLEQNGFLDPKVDEESFMAIQGLIRIPPKTINWSGSAYSLAYFTKKLFGDSNPSLWNLTVKWFTVGNKHLNHATFKTKSHVLKEHPERYDFIPMIDSILSKAVDVHS